MLYVPVYPPYIHQGEALGKMRPHPAFALLMGKRTGKTKTILDDWGPREEAGEIRDLLVFSPAGSLYGDDAWETQVPEHLPPELRERARYEVWRSGGGQTRKKALEALIRERDSRRPRILLVNVEAMSSVQMAQDLCREFLTTSNALRRGAEVVVGESTCIKGTSNRTEEIVELGKMAQVRRIETGLVSPHSPLDLFWQFYFLDPKILGQHSIWGYRARYAIQVLKEFRPGKKTRVIVGWRNEDELRERIAPYSYRKELRDCQDAPPPRYEFRDVELTPEQSRIYKELKRNATAELEAGIHMTPTMAMTRIMRLQQVVCGIFVDDERREHELPERRTTAVLDIVRDYSGKTVIWCAFDTCVRRVVTALRKEFGPQSTAAFWGGNRSTREEEERRFKNDPKCVNMVATAAAGGKGREWSCADLAIYHSNDENLEHRDQSEARTEAVGKVDPRLMIDLRARGTTDEKIIKNLRAKITMAASLQGDPYRNWLV